MASLSDSAVLRKIERQPKRSASYKQLVRELGLHGDQRQQLSGLLDQLVSKGTLLEVEAGRYALPQATAGKNMLVGRLSMHRDGFGFVIPEASSVPATMKDKLAGDIFIPPPMIGSSMHGDRVMVEVTAIRPDGRAEGRIVRPVSRAHATVVGIFHYGNRRNYVTPFDQKITQEIIIPEGMETPETEAAGPEAKRRKKPQHRVIGEEVARKTYWQDLEGLVVDVEITDFPTATQNPRGRVVEILGNEDDSTLR